LLTKVLVAVDGSKSANKALDFALNLAEKYSASLLILNVLELPVYGNPEEPFAVSANLAGFVKDLRKAHENILSRALEKATTTKPSVRVTTELREGDPPSQIVAVADDGGFDAVVLGHGSEGRLKELFLGGTSERVAHLARCIVMIIK
jgi:nucleotide-binding universal stress UspA family protein